MTSAPLNRVGLSVPSRSTSTSLSAGSGKEHPLETPLPPSPSAENRCNQSALILPPDRPDLAGIEAAAQRCSEKGCVFPAAGGGTGKCRQHQRQYREPALFTSLQPSTLLLDRAKFGLPDSDSSEPRVSRSSDRRRQTKLWQAFLEGAA
jgi:hypothetical protein